MTKTKALDKKKIFKRKLSKRDSALFVLQDFLLFFLIITVVSDKSLSLLWELPISIGMLLFLTLPRLYIESNFFQLEKGTYRRSVRQAFWHTVKKKRKMPIEVYLIGVILYVGLPIILIYGALWRGVVVSLFFYGHLFISNMRVVPKGEVFDPPIWE